MTTTPWVCVIRWDPSVGHWSGSSFPVHPVQAHCHRAPGAGTRDPPSPGPLRPRPSPTAPSRAPSPGGTEPGTCRPGPGHRPPPGRAQRGGEDPGPVPAPGVGPVPRGRRQGQDGPRPRCCQRELGARGPGAPRVWPPSVSRIPNLRALKKLLIEDTDRRWGRLGESGSYVPPGTPTSPDRQPGASGRGRPGPCQARDTSFQPGRRQQSERPASDQSLCGREPAGPPSWGLLGPGEGPVPALCPDSR